MDKIQLIKQEIERVYRHYLYAQEFDSGYNMALDDILRFIDSIPEEPASEDLEEEYEKYFKAHEIDIVLNPYTNCKDIARHFAEWQKQQDEKLFKDDSWNYIEENYPNITKEEKLRLYDVSIKSRLAGAKTQKKLDQETIELAEEHAMLAGMEKMKEEMMKDAVDATIFSELKGRDGSVFQAKSDRFRMDGVKISDRIKVIPIKTEQQ